MHFVKVRELKYEIGTLAFGLSLFSKGFKTIKGNKKCQGIYKYND
jgi:hypothetical protein